MLAFTEGIHCRMTHFLKLKYNLLSRFHIKLLTWKVMWIVNSIIAFDVIGKPKKIEIHNTDDERSLI